MSDRLVRAGTTETEPRDRLVIRAGLFVEILSATSSARVLQLGERYVVTGSVWTEASAPDVVDARAVLT